MCHYLPLDKPERRTFLTFDQAQCRSPFQSAIDLSAFSYDRLAPSDPSRFTSSAFREYRLESKPAVVTVRSAASGAGRSETFN